MTADKIRVIHILDITSLEVVGVQIHLISLHPAGWRDRIVLLKHKTGVCLFCSKVISLFCHDCTIIGPHPFPQKLLVQDNQLQIAYQHNNKLYAIDTFIFYLSPALCLCHLECQWVGLGRPNKRSLPPPPGSHLLKPPALHSVDKLERRTCTSFYLSPILTLVSSPLPYARTKNEVVSISLSSLCHSHG